MIGIDMKMPRGCKHCIFLWELNTDEFSVRPLRGEPRFVYRCYADPSLTVSDNRGIPFHKRHKNCPLIELKKENKDEM